MQGRYAIVALVLVFFSWAPLLAQPSTDEFEPLLITEVATENSVSARAEFVEIFNSNDETVELDDFELQYLSASAESCEEGWITKYEFSEEDRIARRGFFLLATEELVAEEFSAEFNSGFSSDGGHLRIVEEVDNEEDSDDSSSTEQQTEEAANEGEDESNNGENEHQTDDTEGESNTEDDASGEEDDEGNTDNQVPHCEGDARLHDFISWGDAEHAQYQPAEAAKDDESLKREVDEDGRFVDTDSSYDDLFVSDTPEPQMTVIEDDRDPEDDSSEETDENEDNTENDEETDSESEDEEEEEPEDDDTDENEDKDYLTVEITELFPDPQTPQTDADDEFIELYNPHEEELDVSGYTVQVGSNLQYTFELDDVVLAPGEYRAFVSKNYNLTLANAGGRAQVIDPNGEVAATLVRYPEAETGESYALVGGEFMWTDNVTPGQPNQKPSVGGRGGTNQTERSSSSTSTTQSDTKNYAHIVLNELMPDPESPQKDADDEFVELYNPNDFEVNLDGYKIRTGSRGTTMHTIENVMIGPYAYQVFYSSESNITLSNSGITVRLQDPNDTDLDTQEYPEAEEGQSWARTESDDWQWTTTLTPAAKNQLTKEPSEDTASSEVTPTSVEAVDGDVQGAAAQPATVDMKQADYRLIVGAGTLALLYGVYEFRHQLYAYLYKLRAYITNR